MAASIGRVLLIPKGTYSGSATYNQLDWVRYNGVAWVCKVNGTSGITPTEGDNWTVLAQDGSVSGSVAWVDVTGKPFDDIDSSDFDTDLDDNLVIKRGTFGSIIVDNDSVDASGDASVKLVAGSNVTITIDDTQTPPEIEFSATGGGGGASSLNDLSDVTISSPSNGQALVYNGTSHEFENQTVATDGYSPSDTAETTIDDTDYFPFYDTSATAKRKSLWSNIKSVLKTYFDNLYSSFTMTPIPSASLSEGDIVTAVNAGLTEGGINDDVISVFGVGKWSNTMTKTYIVQGIAGSSTPIGTSGIGTWDTTGVDQTGWVTVPALVGASSNGNIDVNLLFDPSTVSVPIVLGGYIIDDTTGKMCIKFGNEIPDADTHTAKVGIEVTIKRTETTSVS